VFYDLPLTNGMNKIAAWRGSGPMNIKVRGRAINKCDDEEKIRELKNNPLLNFPHSMR
jgi:hypothetical protein